MATNTKDRDEVFSSIQALLNQLSHEERLLLSSNIQHSSHLLQNIEGLRQCLFNEYLNINSPYEHLLSNFKDQHWLQLINYTIEHLSLKTLLLLIQSIQQCIRRTSKQRVQSLLDQVFIEQCYYGIYPNIILLLQFTLQCISSTILLEKTRERCDKKLKHQLYMLTITDCIELEPLNHTLYTHCMMSPPTTMGIPSYSSSLYRIMSSLTILSSPSITTTTNHSNGNKSSFFHNSKNYQNKLINKKNQTKINDYLWELYLNDNRLLIYRILFQPLYYPIDYWPSQDAIDRIFIAAGYRHNIALMYMLINRDDINHTPCLSSMINDHSTFIQQYSDNTNNNNNPNIVIMLQRQLQRNMLLFPSLYSYEKAFENCINDYIYNIHHDYHRILWYLTGEYYDSSDGSISYQYRQFTYHPRNEIIIKIITSLYRHDSKQRIHQIMDNNNNINGNRHRNINLGRGIFMRVRGGWNMWNVNRNNNNKLINKSRLNEIELLLLNYCNNEIIELLKHEKDKLNASVQQVMRMYTRNSMNNDIHSFSATVVDTVSSSSNVDSDIVVAGNQQQPIIDNEQALIDLLEDNEENDEDDNDEQELVVNRAENVNDQQPHASVHQRKTLNQAVLRHIEDRLYQANIQLFEENQQVSNELKDIVDEYIAEDKRQEAHDRLDKMLRQRRSPHLRRPNIQMANPAGIRRRPIVPAAEAMVGEVEVNEFEEEEEVVEDEKAFDMFNTILTFINHFHPDRRESWIVGFMEESIDARSCLAGALERAVTGLRCIEDEEINRFFGQVEAKNLINLFLTKKMNIFYDNGGSSSTAGGTAERTSSKEMLCNVLSNRYHINARSTSEEVRAALLDYMRGEIAAYQVDLKLYEAEIEATADVISDCFDMLLPFLPA